MSSDTAPNAASEANPDAEERAWHSLAGIDPAVTPFPAPSHIENESIWVFRTKDGFRGVQEACPHQRVMLGTAKLISNDSLIRCALHGFTFRLKDGVGINCRGATIRVFEIREEAGALLGRLAN